MKLEEAFERFSDDVEMKRKSEPIFHADIKWLKQLKAWGNEESRKMGFFVPKKMIEDANADDWEEYKP